MSIQPGQYLTPPARNLRRRLPMDFQRTALQRLPIEAIVVIVTNEIGRALECAPICQPKLIRPFHGGKWAQ